MSKHRHEWRFHSAPEGVVFQNGDIKYRDFWYCIVCRIVEHIEYKENN